MKKRPETGDIVTYIGKAPDGSSIIEHADGRLERRRSRTDWARVDALTDAQIEAAMADDPDWADLKELDWSQATLAAPARKKAISIRVDEDVLSFFKKGGEGYQKRMNAVLRFYMQEKSRSKKRA